MRALLYTSFIWLALLRTSFAAAPVEFAQDIAASVQDAMAGGPLAAREGSHLFDRDGAGPDEGQLAAPRSVIDDDDVDLVSPVHRAPTPHLLPAQLAFPSHTRPAQPRDRVDRPPRL